MIEKIILKKSSVLDKMPAADQLEFGELALNYNAEHPFLSFKDSDGNITALNDYAEDIDDLWNEKLDVSYYNEFNNGITQNATDISWLKKNSATKADLIVDKKDLQQEISDTKNDLDGAIAEKVDKTDIVQSTGSSETAVMSQKAVSDALSNVAATSEFEYCGLMEWDGKNEVKIYEMKFDSPKREVFIFAQCTYNKTNKGDFKIIITNETQPSGIYGISYYNSSSYAEENFHIHNVCGNYVCDIINSNNHVVSSALKRCYMRNLLTDKNHEDVGLITNLKIEITTDLVRIDGVQKWYVFGK